MKKILRGKVQTTFEKFHLPRIFTFDASGPSFGLWNKIKELILHGNCNFQTIELMEFAKMIHEVFVKDKNGQYF